MRLDRVAAGALLCGAWGVAAEPAVAQSADAGSRAASTASGTPSGNAASAAASATSDGSPDTSKAAPRCWLGCTGTLQHTSVVSWQIAPSQGLPSQLQSGLARPARSVRDTLLPHQSTASLELPPERAMVGADTSAAARVLAERFWIDEWRASELAVADSLHHATLVRITRLFDSVQSDSIPRDEYLRVLREVDAVDQMNQQMWLRRRWDVVRQADSALGATARPTP